MRAVTVSTDTEDTRRLYRLSEARKYCIAEINLREQQGVRLTGTEVVAIIDDFCIELQCSRAEMPESLRFTYTVASDEPDSMFGKEVIIKELNQAA